VKRRAFSLLELMVTLAIMAFVLAAVLELLSQTRYQMDYINRDLANQTRLQHSLNKLMDDLVLGSKDEINIEIKREFYNGLETAWLKISSGDKAARGNKIDWVAVPREYEEDLVLFRRQSQPGSKGKALFIPQCDNLYAFDVDMLDPNGDPGGDPNDSTLIEVWAQLYRMGDRDPDRVLSMKRTISLHRFRRQ
jgi:prepilin-type N-terminal cleavage/methylation domain-containing protein